ncbi:MAG: S41 family peptidase, partial [Bacteroidota bacterium]
AEVATVLRTLQDSHSSLNLGALLRPYIADDGKVMQFRIFSPDSSTHLIKSDVLNLIPKGSKVISVNGQPFQSVYDHALRHALQEGNSPEGILAISDALAVPMTGVSIELKNGNEIVYLDPEGKQASVNYPAKTSKDWKKWRKQNKDLWPKKERYELSYPHDSVAVMRISTFGAPKGGEYYKFIHKSFKELTKENIPNLIIDLRHNTGGKGHRMERLFSHVNEDTLRLPSSIIAKQSPTARKLHAKSFKGINKFVLTKLRKKNEDAVNYVRLVTLEDGQTDTLYYMDDYNFPKHRYKGNVVLLIDGLSGSASVVFASGFRQTSRGKIYGQPCLGPIEGTWGNPSRVALDSTGVQVVLSTIRFNANNTFKSDPTPIQPDVLFVPDQNSLAKEEDALIEMVLRDLGLR